MRLACLLCLTVCAASPAASDVQTLRPVGCKRAATAQYDNCSITNTFRCTDGPAAFWVESLDADNILTVETRNADHGSQSVTFVGQDFSMQLVQSKAHPRDTIRMGSASDSISGDFMLFGMVRPVTGRTAYSHAGETIVLAGEPFARIDFVGSITFPPPMTEIHGDGSFLYSERLDLLVEEVTRYEIGGPYEGYALAHLALPGQEGFGDETPDYGCGEMSGLPHQDLETRA